MADPAPRVAVVVEDDLDIRNLLEAILSQAGFVCHSYATGVEGIEGVRRHQPILTTLDISLPGIDGFEVARRIRRFSSTYIIVLSARDEEIDTLMGLDAGADDYLTKPFRPRELRARVEAMLRRYHPSGEPGRDGADRAGDGTSGSPPPDGATETISVEPEEGWLSHNGLRVHPDMRLAELDGHPLELTRSEFELLLTILLGQRRVISKSSLAAEMRGEHSSAYITDSDRRAVEVHLANLRRKLNDSATEPRFVETVRGVGYRLAGRQTS